MTSLALLPAAAIALMGASASAQPTQDAATPWGWDQAQSHAAKTWHVMIAVEQAIGPQGCDTYRFKVSSVEPIEISGPPEVRRAHADELASWWMMYVAQRAPLAYRWLTTSAGHEPPEIYFRETREEVMEAFRADGHLRNNRSCSGSKLVGLRTRSFEFTPPPGFTTVDFGFEPAPQNVTVARELSPAPGAR